MIDLSGMISIPYLKKSRFTGSYRGMRYALQKREQKEGEPLLEAVIWPEPYCCELTQEEKKRRKNFELSREGLSQAVNWLNNEYRQGEY